VYAGTNNNTYAGLTTVNQGELDLAKSGGVVVLAIPAYGPGLVIGDGVDAAIVRKLWQRPDLGIRAYDHYQFGCLGPE